MTAELDPDAPNPPAIEGAPAPARAEVPAPAVAAAPLSPAEHEAPFGHAPAHHALMWSVPATWPPQHPPYGWGHHPTGYHPTGYAPSWQPFPHTPAPRRSSAGAVLALIAVGAVVGTAMAAGLRPTGTALTQPSPASSSVGGAPSSLSPLPTQPPASSSGGGPSLDVSAVAARVDPAIVDINVTVIGGTAQGTGMILTSTGEVLTNNHVVEGARSLTVQIDGAGPLHPATVVGVDAVDDVALVQITGVSGLPVIPLGNSSSVAVGDAIVALGNALGAGGTPATAQGVVTALDQTITASDDNGANVETLNGMIEVQAGIQPGDSGGPLADASGHVVGMTTAGSSRVRRTGSLGYAIPINAALSVAHQIQTGSGPNVLPGHRGILGVEVDPTIANAGGAAISRVEPNSPAAAAGIVAGDVITGIDARTIDSAATLSQVMRPHLPGDHVTVRWRDSAGQSHSAAVTLESGPPA